MELQKKKTEKESTRVYVCTSRLRSLTSASKAPSPLRTKKFAMDLQWTLLMLLPESIFTPQSRFSARELETISICLSHLRIVVHLNSVKSKALG